MKVEYKARWLDALRSGQYHKGKMYLKVRQSDGTYCYCPLGVLVEILKGDLPVKQVEITGYDVVIINGLTAIIADELTKEIGITYGEQMTVAELNDTKNMSLEEVADWIETNV